MSTLNGTSEALTAVATAAEALCSALGGIPETARETLRTPPEEWLDGWPGHEEPEADPGRGWVEAPPAVLVPEPPGELPAHLDRRLTAIENRLAEVHRLADRSETRLDAQLGRILELEVQAAAAAVGPPVLDRVGAELELHGRLMTLEALVDAQRVTLEALQAAGTPTQARIEAQLESVDAAIAAARRHGIIR